MNLVLEYDYADYECSCTITFPFEYDSSPEQALLDFEQLILNAIKNNQSSFEFCDEEFSLFDFYTTDKLDKDHIDLPDVYYLEDWHRHNTLRRNI